MRNTYSLKIFVLTVAIPIVAFWTILFIFGYPLPNEDDLFFIGAAINLAKGGEFINPYLEAWNSVFSSGKFYYQPPFHSFTLAGWLKFVGISTNSLLLFQYLCYNTFSLSSALILRAYGFPRITALCTTIIFAAWHCNPNPFYSTGLRQDALGMAYLALGLWLLTNHRWWRYFLGFSFIESAVLTSPITVAYAIPFGLAIGVINFIDREKLESSITKYLITKGSAFLAATGLVMILFLLSIKLDTHGFLSDFLFHASLRRTPFDIAIPYFLMLISRYYGYILNVPTYILFLCFILVVFLKRNYIPLVIKILFVAINVGIIFNILLYSAAIWVTFFFCWVCIICTISLVNLDSKTRLYASILAIFIFLSSQGLNILSLLEREYINQYEYREIKAAVSAKPNRKYAVDEIAARFVFDYKLPANSIAWNFMKTPPNAYPTSAKDKQPDVTWIVSKYHVGHYVRQMLKDYPKVEFLGRTFNSLPKMPFDVILIP